MRAVRRGIGAVCAVAATVLVGRGVWILVQAFSCDDSERFDNCDGFWDQVFLAGALLGWALPLVGAVAIVVAWTSLRSSPPGAADRPRLLRRVTTFETVAGAMAALIVSAVASGSLLALDGSLAATVVNVVLWPVVCAAPWIADAVALEAIRRHLRKGAAVAVGAGATGAPEPSGG